MEIDGSKGIAFLIEKITIIILLSSILGSVTLAQSPVSVESNISVSVTIPSATPPGGGGGGGGGIIPFPEPGPAKVIFEGKAYPSAFVTLLKNGKVASTVIADSSGDFQIILTGIASGTWNFGVFAEDTEGRKSVTLGFSTNIMGGMDTTISGIFLSPTIALSESSVKQGDPIDIVGQAYPRSEVNIFVSSPQTFTEKVISEYNGKWKHSFDTSVLELGSHTIKAKAQTDSGHQSPFSEDMQFKVIGVCQGSDLNFDGKINLVDFSILLYYWGQKNPANICTDINSDKDVNLIDFSIMMYWWTG